MTPRIASLCTYINYSSEQHQIVWEDHRIKLVYVEKQGARRVRFVQIAFKNTQMSIPATLFLFFFLTMQWNSICEENGQSAISLFE